MVAIIVSPDINGVDTSIETRLIQRLRPITASERQDHPLAQTLLNYVNPSSLFVRNICADLMASIAQSDASEGALFGKLTSIDGYPIHFRGPGNAVGPIFVASVHLVPGIQSALLIGGKRQYVRETPAEVSAEIGRCGGTVAATPGIPPPDAGGGRPGPLGIPPIADFETWDDNVPELSLKPLM